MAKRRCRRLTMTGNKPRSGGTTESKPRSLREDMVIDLPLLLKFGTDLAHRICPILPQLHILLVLQLQDRLVIRYALPRPLLSEARPQLVPLELCYRMRNINDERKPGNVLAVLRSGTRAITANLGARESEQRSIRCMTRIEGSYWTY